MMEKRQEKFLFFTNQPLWGPVESQLHFKA